MKNKLFKKFLVLIMILCETIISVNAAKKPSDFPYSVNIYVTGGTTLVYNTSYPGTDRYKINANVKQTGDGVYVYCIEADKNTIPDDTPMSFDAEIEDAGLAYIVANGFPYKKFGFDDETAYGITQTAIWLYYQIEYGVKCPKLANIVDSNGRRIDDYNGGSNPEHSSRKKIDKVWELYNAAKKAKKAGDVTPKITTTVANKTLTLSAGTLLSEEVTVNLKNATTYKVTADNNAIIVDSNGNKKTSFKSGEKFRVKLENAGNTATTVNVTITTEGTTNKVYSYKSRQNSTLQKVVYGAVAPEIITITSKLKFTYEPKINEVEFSKIDATTNKELPGAHLEVRDANGNLIEAWVSTNETHFIKLQPGKYKLTETIAPDGYVLSTETIEFEVKADGTTSKVVMKNTPKDKSVEFSKIDATTNKELPGAHLEVRDANGNLIEAWVSTNETHFIKLQPGKYKLTETIAPDGYVLSTETIEFEVKVDGTTSKVVMKNTPKDKSVEFSKIDVSTGKELPGAHLEVRDSKGNLIEAWVSTNETHFIKLQPGKYTLKETIAPDGYALSTETIEFEVKVDGTTTKVVMENKPYVIVPPTDLDASQTIMIMGGLLLGLGFVMIYGYIKKSKVC